MVTISDLKARKRKLGYTNEQVAKLSGVPLSTVQKVFGGTTANPRRETLKALENVLPPEAEGREHEAADKGMKIIEAGKTDLNVGLYYTINRSPDEFQIRDTELAYLIKDANTDSKEKKPGDYTVEDYYRIPDDVRVELIDGRMYMKAAPSTRHQYIAAAVVAQMLSWQMDHDSSCLALVSPVDVQLDEDEKTVVQPDLVAVCDREKVREGIIFGAPDLVMEVLSPSSAGKDRFLKFNKYWRAGVKEYWIIDPFEETVTVYLFSAGKPPEEYSFQEQIPVGLTGGGLSIDFSVISEFGRRFFEKR
ncbi:MAG: Uma2 family endonuclease [Firmicutes bacterium]|nr:Uma2 family endonuclease [Bacillota bacterium]